MVSRAAPLRLFVCISSVDLASYAFLVGIDAEVPLKCHRVRVSSKKEPVAFHLLAEMQRFLGKRAGLRATGVSSQGREESRYFLINTNINTIVGNNNPTGYNVFREIKEKCKCKNKLQIRSFEHDAAKVSMWNTCQYNWVHQVVEKYSQILIY